MQFQTKADFQDRLFDVLTPLLPHYSEGKARLVLGHTGVTYDEATVELEGFGRALWGLGAFLGGGGSSPEFQAIYQEGLANGSNPSSPEYWGTYNDYDQRFVEMAGIAVGLMMAPEQLWNPLSEEAKDNLASWLAGINYHELVPSNWQFFGVLVNAAFKKLRRPEFNQSRLDASLANINGYYIGNGWYQDGVLANRDYYIPFAFHYYGLLYSVFMAEEDPENSQRFRERAEIFGKQFVYWFDDNGPSVPYGRSLTYRYAQVAFYSACVFAGVEPFEIPVMKGLISRHLESWWNTHMLDLAGISSIGYYYPNLNMAENYNAPGSPLWALKAFAILALDDGHDFWSCEAAPMPQLEQVVTQMEPSMVLTHKNGVATIYPSGFHSDSLPYGHFEEKYSKIAYSTKFGFNIRKSNDSLENMAPDSDLVFKIGNHFFGRDGVDGYTIDDGKVTSRWTPFPGISVTTVVTPTEAGHSRIHTIKSNIECTVYDCAFAVSTEAGGYATAIGDDYASISTNDTLSKIEGGKGQIIAASPNTNLLFPRTAIPAVSYDIPVGETIISSTITHE